MPNEELTFTAQNILFNTIHQNPKHVCNFFILVGKQLLYAKKCLGQILTFQELKGTIQKYQTYEKYKAIKEGKLQKHLKKWLSYDNNENVNQCNIDKNFAIEYLESVQQEIA